MNKIITVLLIFVLCSCSTERVRTSDLSVPPASSERLYSKLNTETSDEEENLLPKITRYLKQGIASWYGSNFHGKKTASGEIYDMYAMTAAHRTLPLSSYARITNLDNQRSVIVRINDRGPYHGDRVMDLSYAAAKKLDLDQAGIGTIEINALAPGQTEDNAENQKNPVYLHVGTFANKIKAQNLQRKIADNNLPQPEILASEHQGSTLYKVQMGPIQSSVSAGKLNNQLARLGITATQFDIETNQKQISMIQ
jgi:rare lipoprotein A